MTRSGAPEHIVGPEIVTVITLISTSRSRQNTWTGFPEWITRLCTSEWLSTDRSQRILVTGVIS